MADEGLELKKLTTAGLAAAHDKADTYRLLNEPEAAESICLDILELQPDNLRALRCIILAITDQFSEAGGNRQVSLAKRYARSLTDAYERLYYLGIICEREAKAYLFRGMSSRFAYEGFRAAMDHYREAEEIRRRHSPLQQLRAHHPEAPPAIRDAGERAAPGVARPAAVCCPALW